MTQYNKITALYSRLSVGDEDRDGGESNSIVNQKAFLERYARQEKLTNIRHYIDDDESGRFFDRSAYVRMIAAEHSRRILDRLTAQRGAQPPARNAAYPEAQDEADEDEDDDNGARVRD